ncbi:MAG: hypothetical protein WBW61_04990 [Rhodanobacteraceae bacterium]
MQSRKLALLVALACAGGMAAVAPQPASARVHVGIVVGVPPPAPRYEVVPPPRAGWVWAPGYWRWGGRHYIWVGGTWQHSRPGYVYYGPRWDHDRDHWVYRRSHWDRDPHWHHHGRDDRHHHHHHH